MVDQRALKQMQKGNGKREGQRQSDEGGEENSQE